MKKILVGIGLLSIAGIIFFAGLFVGYSTGEDLSDEEVNQANQTSKWFRDVTTLYTNSENLYRLCESKYQMIGKNNTEEAIRINGQMDVIEAQNENIKSNYPQGILQSRVVID